MSDFAARVGRVRMKNGGAYLTVIEGWQSPDEETCEAALYDVTREVADRRDLSAFFLTTMHTDGEVTFSHFIDGDCGIPRTLLPAYVGELVRRNVLTRSDSRQVFETMFEWAE